MPDVWLDETAEGNVCSRRCACARPTSSKHLHKRPGTRSKDAAREKAREEARKKLEEELAKNNDRRPKPLPEFGSAEDFQLTQALNRLQGPAGDGQQDRRSSARPKPTPTTN